MILRSLWCSSGAWCLLTPIGTSLPNKLEACGGLTCGGLNCKLTGVQTDGRGRLTGARVGAMHVEYTRGYGSPTLARHKWHTKRAYVKTPVATNRDGGRPCACKAIPMAISIPCCPPTPSHRDCCRGRPGHFTVCSGTARRRPSMSDRTRVDGQNHVEQSMNAHSQEATASSQPVFPFFYKAKVLKFLLCLRFKGIFFV